MDLGGFLTWVVMGVFVGWLAGFVLPEGGHGWLSDVVLGLAGSSATSSAVWIAGVAGGASVVAMTLVAFVGAAVLVVGQRKIWPAPLVAPRKPRSARRI